MLLMTNVGIALNFFFRLDFKRKFNNMKHWFKGSAQLKNCVIDEKKIETNICSSWNNNEMMKMENAVCKVEGWNTAHKTQYCTKIW